jgi:hypothetical protein
MRKQLADSRDNVMTTDVSEVLSFTAPELPANRATALAATNSESNVPVCIS